MINGIFSTAWINHLILSKQASSLDTYVLWIPANLPAIDTKLIKSNDYSEDRTVSCKLRPLKVNIFIRSTYNSNSPFIRNHIPAQIDSTYH